MSPTARRVLTISSVAALTLGAVVLLGRIEAPLTGQAVGGGSTNAVQSFTLSGVTNNWTSVGLSSTQLSNAALFAQAVTYNGVDTGLARLNAAGNVRYQEASDGTHDNGETVNVLAILGNLEALGVPAEIGSFNLGVTGGSGSYTLNFRNWYAEPVLILQVATENGAQPVAAVPLSMTTNSAVIGIREPSTFDGTHMIETIHYLVVESGAYNLGGGKVLAAGKTSAGDSWTTIPLGPRYSDFAVVTTPQSRSVSGYGAIRVQKGSSSIQVKQVREVSGTISGTIGWVAYGSGVYPVPPIGCESCPTSCDPTLAWGYKSNVIANARQGDLLVHVDAEGELTPLFEALGQTYTHSAMFVDDGSTIRHSTMDAGDLDYDDKGEVEIEYDSLFGNCEGDVWVDHSDLTNARPGLCEMDPQSTTCTSNQGTTHTYEWDETTWTIVRGTALRRARLKEIAEKSEGVDGYYRLHAFIDYEGECDLTESQLADKTVQVCTDGYCRKPGCMCAGMIAQSSDVAGFDGAINNTHAYSAAETAAAAYAAYQSVYNSALDEIRSMSVSDWTDANCERQIARTLAQQFINCFVESGTCDNLSDDYVDAASQYVSSGTGSWNITGLSISADNLISNGTGSGYYLAAMVDPDAQSGWGMYPNGYGTCR